MDRRDFLTGMIATGLAAKAFSVLGASNPNGYVYLPSIPVLAHFVNWHTIPGGWDTAATMPVRHDNNSVHGYTSTNPEIITQQNTEMVRNGIVLLISWWGRDSYAGDKFLDTYLSVSKGDLPKIGILYESVNRDQSRMHTLPNGEVNLHDPYNANLLNSDLVHLDNKYFSRYPDRFFHVDGRPIVFLWNSHIFHGNLEEIIYPARCQANFFLMGSNFSINLTRPEDVPQNQHLLIRGMDAISSYVFYDVNHYGENITQEMLAAYSNCVLHWSYWLAENSPHTKLVLPYNLAYDETKIPGRQGWLFRCDYATAMDYADMLKDFLAKPCNPLQNILPMIYMTSYNEHYEGSAIEPSQEYGTFFLDLVNNTFNKPVIFTPDELKEFCVPGEGPYPRR